MIAYFYRYIFNNKDQIEWSIDMVAVSGSSSCQLLSPVYHLLAVWLKARYLTSLCLNLLAGKWACRVMSAQALCTSFCKKFETFNHCLNFVLFGC